MFPTLVEDNACGEAVLLLGIKVRFWLPNVWGESESHGGGDNKQQVEDWSLLAAM